MTAVEMNAIFDLICDKTGSDYFLPSEKDHFLNLAMDSVKNDYFYNIKKKAQIEGIPPYGFEMSQLVSEVFWPVIEQVSVNANSSGEVSVTAINTAMGGSKKTDHIIAVAVPGASMPCSSDSDDYTYCKFVRHNDYNKFLKNDFKRPSEEYPVFRYISNKIKVNPTGIRPVLFTVVRVPIRISTTTPVNCELPDFLHNEIIMRALTLAGISIRERELYSATEQIKAQNG